MITLHTPETATDDFYIPAEAPFSTLIRQGQTVRIIDLHGQQAVDTLLYNAHDTTERYSAQDTIRAQGAAYVGVGTKIMSNEGRVMATVTADTSGRHDTCAGACSRESNTVRFGAEAAYMHACRDNFLIAMARHGMDARDIVPNINFFMNVPISPDGTMTIVDGLSKPGDHVEFVAAMDLLLVISNCPQVMNPCNGFDPTPIRVLVWDAED